MIVEYGPQSPFFDETRGESSPALNEEQFIEIYKGVTPVVRSRILTQLIVDAFESGSPVVRRHVLDRLLRPLGVLSLVAVAGGIFSKIPLRSNWRNVHVQIEDVQNVSAGDLTALVDHVQQVSVEAVFGIAQMIAASPVMAGSAAAAVIVTLLIRNARIARANGHDEDDFPDAVA